MREVVIVGGARTAIGDYMGSLSGLTPCWNLWRKYMAGHKVYSAIVHAVKAGTLKDPFTNHDFRRACPGLGEGTYRAFLHKHRKGNSGGAFELFELTSPGKFRLLRPFRYDL